MAKLKGMSGLATVVLAAGTVTTVNAEELVETTVKKVEHQEAESVDLSGLVEAEKSVTESQELLAKQEEVVDQAKAEEVKAEESVAELSQELAGLEEVASNATPEAIETTELELNKVEEQLTTDAQTVATQKEKLGQAQEVLGVQGVLVKEANTSLESAEAALAVAEETLVAAEANLSETHKETLESDLEAKKVALEEAEAERSEAEKAVEVAGVKDAEQANELTKLSEATKLAESELAEKTESLAQATSDVTAQEEQVDGLQAEIAQLKATIAQLEETLQIDKTDALRDLEKALDAVSEAQTELRLAEQAMALAEQSEKQRQQALAQARVRLQEEQDKYNRATAELERITREYHAAKPNSSVTSFTYFNQRDPAVFNHVIGLDKFASTGCGPTVLAMVFSELLGRTVAPLEVGYWLYNNTNEFNKRFTGTAGIGLAQAARGYGLDASGLTSHEALVQSLQEGHLVIAGVQNNKFSPWGPQYSHWVALKGYSNGQTYVYDPYERGNIGWYPVANLWREQSREPDDYRQLGAPFIQVSSPRLAQLQAEKQTAEARVRQLDNWRYDANSQLAALENDRNDLVAATSRLDKAKQTLALANQTVNNGRVKVSRLESAEVTGKAGLQTYRDDLTKKEAALLVANQALLAAKGVQSQAHDLVNKAKVKLTNLSGDLLALGNKATLLPEAKLALSKATEHLDKAEKDYQTAQLAFEKFSASKPEKLAAFEAAKADVEAKKALKASAKETLKVALTKYMSLKDNYEKEALALAKQEQKKSTRTNLASDLKAKLTIWKAVPAKLETTKTALTKAKEDLASKKELANKELALLKSLQAKHEETSQQYEKLQKAYSAYVEAQRHTELVAAFEAIQQAGGVAVPVVDEQGKVVDYKSVAAVETPASAEGVNRMAVAPLVVRESKQQVAKSVASMSVTRTSKQLPKTSDGASLVTMGLASIGLAIGLAGLRRKENN